VTDGGHFSHLMLHGQFAFNMKTEIVDNSRRLNYAHCPVNKCISELARCKSYHSALRDAAKPTSDCSPSVAADFDFCFEEPALLISEGCAAAVTPRLPKFTKIGEDLSG